MNNSIQGIVTGVYISNQPDSAESTALAEAEVLFEGFRGDKHSGFTMRSNSRTPFYPRGTMIRNTRQVTLVSMEELAETAVKMGLACIEPGWIGANVALQGIPKLTLLPPGSRLFFPNRKTASVVLIVTELNKPCTISGRAIASHFPDRPELAQQFVKAAYQKRGVTAVVEKPGQIKPGDTVEVEIEPILPYDA